MRIRADTGSCVASGLCAYTAPEVFGQRAEDGVVVVLVQEAPEEHRTAVHRAVADCPVQVLSVDEGRDPEESVMAPYKAVLTGGPAHLPEDLRIQHVADLAETVKLPFGSGYEHFAHHGGYRTVDGERIPEFRWVGRTALAE
ncbi:DUF5988 family protein [Streptomyces boncukensis]|uniref:Ferredoxin n=1 Tax=Streptomyces boncukensis TaxID=2711219 RepID=A0A6G4WNU0_9ACTN|nr:DUF5988 family protein [Streptomyces boncukensis]NGO66865.1 ferredoxin [Streptomyces boncukensis]